MTTHGRFWNCHSDSAAVYRYFGVPAQIYRELMRAESKDKYFNSHTRNRFHCSKLATPPSAT